jgi:DNA invertase Pin-like site-specific DNA recombinase
MQRLAIERAASSRGDTLVAIYAEKRSARTLARPELDRLRRDARAGAVRRIYVWRLDRIARTGIKDLFDVIEEWRSLGVDLVTLTDGFALDGPAADVILAVMAWAARMERVAINERISAARDRLEAEGRRWGRPPRLGPAQMSRVRELRLEGRSIRAISIALKIPRSTVGRTLARMSTAQAPERPTGR